MEDYGHVGFSQMLVEGMFRAYGITNTNKQDKRK